MAVLKICTFRDSKAAAFGPLMCFNTLGLAARAFEQAVQDPQTLISRHPSDFSMWELGEFDNVEGTFKIHNVPINLGGADQYVKHLSAPAEEMPLKGIDSAFATRAQRGSAAEARSS